MVFSQEGDQWEAAAEVPVDQWEAPWALVACQWDPVVARWDVLAPWVAWVDRWEEEDQWALVDLTAGPWDRAIPAGR